MNKKKQIGMAILAVLIDFPTVSTMNSAKLQYE